MYDIDNEWLLGLHLGIGNLAGFFIALIFCLNSPVRKVLKEEICNCCFN